MTSRVEWEATSGRLHTDPFNQIEVTVAFTAPDGNVLTVPLPFGRRAAVACSLCVPFAGCAPLPLDLQRHGG